jgi:twitching motility protein PilT
MHASWCWSQEGRCAGRDEYGMQTMDQHLIQLCRDELITLDEAKRISRSKDLERKLMFN